MPCSAAERNGHKYEKAVAVQKKSNDFLSLAIRVDKQVAIFVNKNKEEFYKTNPWLRPAVEEERPWYEKTWSWLCDKGEEIAEGVKNAWTWVKDTAKKAWDGLVEFYNEHKKALATILMIAGAITALIIISLIPGGGILATIIAGAAWGTIFGAVIGGVSGGLESMSNGGSFWEGAEEGAFSGAISGAISGAAFAGIGAAGQIVGKSISCMSTVGKSVKVIAKVSQVGAAVMDGFDTLALIDRVVDPASNPLADLNAKAHSNPIYNFVQVGTNVVATFTGSMTQSMTCFVAGTLVLTAAGLVAIENIRAGDLVISTDPETMVTAQKPVLETYVLQNNRLVHLCAGGERITTTENHPFYVQERGFVDAGDLQPGNLLRKRDGSVVLLDSWEVEQLQEPVTVYNFQVEDYHTYYVGNSCFFVHNADCVVEFDNDSGLDREEFRKQLTNQEKGMNELTVDEYLNNRKDYIKNGRAPESSLYQKQARAEAVANRIETNQLNGMNYRYGRNEIMIPSPQLFFTLLSDTAFLKKYFTMNLYRAAVAENGALAYDECFSFTPILALGGSEKLERIQKAKIREHVSVMYTLGGGIM